MAEWSGGEETYIEASAFEGLFVRALQPTGQFAEELARAGFDVHARQARYPTPVWNACIEVARRHVHPALAPRDAYRALGKQLCAGFLDTLVGRVIGAGLTLLGLEGTLKRVPRYLMSITPGVTVTAEREDATRWRLRSQTAHGLPDVTAGLLEEGLSRTGRRVTVEVVSRRHDGYELLVHW